MLHLEYYIFQMFSLYPDLKRYIYTTIICMCSIHSLLLSQCPTATLYKLKMIMYFTASFVSVWHSYQYCNQVNRWPFWDARLIRLLCILLHLLLLRSRKLTYKVFPQIWHPIFVRTGRYIHWTRVCFESQPVEMLAFAQFKCRQDHDVNTLQ